MGKIIMKSIKERTMSATSPEEMGKVVDDFNEISKTCSLASSDFIPCCFTGKICCITECDRIMYQK